MDDPHLGQFGYVTIKNKYILRVNTWINAKFKPQDNYEYGSKFKTCIYHSEVIFVALVVLQRVIINQISHQK